MTVLDASFQSNGRAANIVEPGNVVDIVFTTPPPSATNVKVQIIEAPGPGDVVTTDRLIATFSGSITGNKFTLDGPSNDPLDTNPQSNPVIANFNHSSFPPKFSMRFKDDPTKQSDIILPDVENENGSYEIKLNITGTVSGATVTSAGSAILQLRIWLDVMIVPDVPSATAAQKQSTEFGVFNDNYRFSQQWLKFAGARRQVSTVPIDGTLAQFESIVNAAAPKAKKGDLILFVGHGVAGTQGAPTVFDTTPSSVHGLTTQHPNAISTTVLNLPNVATQDASGKWIANDKISTDAQRQVDAIAPRFDALKRIGGVLKQNSVSRFILMTCDMSLDPSFGSNLAKLLQIPVAAYPGFVASTTGSGAAQSLTQIWLTHTRPVPGHRDPEQPADTDPNAPSFHEIPGGLRSFSP